MLTEGNIRLLSDWAQALRRLNQTDWQSSGWNMGAWAMYKLPESPDLTCGTVCCAYGLGTTLPSWRAEGIGLEEDNRQWSTKTPEGIKSCTVRRWKAPRRVSEKLGLDDKDFSWITDSGGYPEGDGQITPLHVAQRIEEYIARG